MMFKKAWGIQMLLRTQVFCRISSNSKKKQQDFSWKGGRMVGDNLY